MKDVATLDIRALRIFEVVAASGSLSTAAAQLQITQSAVSQAVTQIEQILGTKVLDRSRRPFKLTAAGVALSRRARQIVDDMDRLIAQVHEADMANRPKIRVGMIDSFAAMVGPAIMKKVSVNASQVLLWSGLAHSHAQSLLNRHVDLIVTSDLLEDMDGLVRRPLFTEPFLVVLPKCRQEQFEDADLGKLVQEMQLVRFSARSHFGAMIERYLRRRGMSAPHYLEIDTSDVVMAMIAADLGWTITTPLCLLQGRVYMKDVVAIPLPGAALTRTIYQISREDEYEEMAEHFYQTSRRVLEQDVFPEMKAHVPWLGAKVYLN
ncbi:LysR family transcriptional regulator [Noviherbaspirillum cavernae]|uniref:LysR family transcriptional regulator n=1 Tax=Noviherbaspirillum cavernae TaxID=2320862 RepID=A0A418WXQ1_9BURK|nr:LysR family transcriptional regulator [Noviherbaspirillum cavernae]RJG05014.1 LysR family transcriptional regulator [Noviherbaspirillum cavernae]